jgi:hypothetical protein
MVRDHPWRRPCSPSASLHGLWWLSVPQRARFEFEGAGKAADPDLRLVSERSRYMRTTISRSAVRAAGTHRRIR